MRNTLLYCYIIMFFIFYSCNTKENKIYIPKNTKEIKKITPKESTIISRFWTSDEAYIIKKFVERNNWKAIKTQTGMYYYIYSSNLKGIKPKNGDIAIVNYKIRLLDAETTLCYSSNKEQPQSVYIDMDNVETGIHEALKHIREGEKAYVILPHYLAHGLTGDLDKIPPLSPVLYDLELIKIKTQE